ncbi:MAG: winged helix-turn-helix transcriptional regulator [Acidimicrobiia bacterium]|nr:winged helix-turn-helix transcriptional regulator [Acidimicrobiia bacterium]
MDVELLRWPGERQRRERLRANGRPRLLLVEHGVEPPTPSDLLEDWIRVPAARSDVRARIDGILRRAEFTADAEISIDDTGSLRSGAHRIPLPPVEAQILAELIDQQGKVVSRAALVAAVWPDDPPDRNVLDVHLVRLRRRVAEAGLQIRTIRSRGLLLERL